MRALARLREQPADAGINLVELLLYSFFLTAIFAVSGGLLISAISAQNQVTGFTEAADKGQLIARSIEEGVRNASGPAGAASPDEIDGIRAEAMTASPVGQLLRARVAVGAVDATVQWECQAWYYSGETGAVYFTRSSTGAIADPGNFSVVGGEHVPNAGSARWLLLGDGITLPADAPEFFGTSGQGRVVLKFEVASDDVSLVLIPNTVVTRKSTIGGTGPTACF